MRIDQDARAEHTEGELEELKPETDLAESAAAETNLPPVGTHDADVDLEREYPRPGESPADD